MHETRVEPAKRLGLKKFMKIPMAMPRDDCVEQYLYNFSIRTFFSKNTLTRKKSLCLIP